MPRTNDDLLQLVDDLNARAEGSGLKLRLDLSGLILQRLRLLKWRQRDLARATGLKESFVSRVLHSNANCTLDTVARLLHALGVQGELRESITEPWLDASELPVEFRNTDETSIEICKTAQETS